MEIEFITLADLKNFKEEILSEIKSLLKRKNELTGDRKWIKSKEVQKLLQISAGTLQNLRNRRMIPFTRLGGVIYYSREDLKKVLENQDEGICDFFGRKNDHTIKKVRSNFNYELKK